MTDQPTDKELIGWGKASRAVGGRPNLENKLAARLEAMLKEQKHQEAISRSHLHDAGVNLRRAEAAEARVAELEQRIEYLRQRDANAYLDGYDEALRSRLLELRTRPCGPAPSVAEVNHED